jgi:hypothetical protein
VPCHTGAGAASPARVAEACQTRIDIDTAMLAALPPERAAALCETVTAALDTTDVEVYGHHKRGVAYN